MTSTLNDIRLKVRRVTKAPSSNQITDAQIDSYINNFYLFDFPEHLRLFSLRETINITLLPNIDVYPLPTGTPVSVPMTALGNAVGATTSFNLFTILGIDATAKIIPGTVTAQVLTTVMSEWNDFSTTSNYSGSLNAISGNASGGFIDYQNGILTLQFDSAIVATQAQVSFQYSLPEYLTVHPPLYIAGYESYLTQSRTDFFRMYPTNRTFQQLSTGTGITGPYTGVLSATPVLRNNVLISTLDTAGNPMNVTDDGLGNLVGQGTGTIDYVLGNVSVTYNSAVLVSEPITIQTVPYVAARPQTALFFNDIITVRPVPDQSYTLNIEAYKRPTALFASTQSPELNEWWQCIAMGASLRIFEDRGDFNQIQQYRPLLQEYLMLCQRRTLVQQTNERAQTIYTDQGSSTFGNYYGAF